MPGALVDLCEGESYMIVAPMGMDYYIWNTFRAGIFDENFRTLFKTISNYIFFRGYQLSSISTYPKQIFSY